MRLVFVLAALLASSGAACSLLLDDEGFASPPEPVTDGGTTRADAASTPDGGDAAVDNVAPAPEIGNGTGKSGALVVTGETIVNTYAALSADAAMGTSVLAADATLGWLPGDVLFVWETTGLAGSTSGSVASTDLSATPIGRHELVRITTVEPNGSGVKITIASPLTNTYRSGNTQLVRVPEHTDVTVTASGRLRATPWDGTRGGIVVVLATGTVQIDGVLDVDAQGFRGGLVFLNGGFSDCPGLDGVPRAGYAAKGEGVAPSGYSSASDAGDARGGRGAVANGAGGGNCHNSGGGGGGNGGTGGKGGRAWASSSYADVGGFGGSAIEPTTEARIVLGGGGGAGDAEDSLGEKATPGAAGGGAIYLRASTIAVGGTMSARGGSGAAGDKNGGSGGGAGGTIVLRATSRISCGQLLANGGSGSMTVNAGIGPGGGGGGGRVFLAAPTIECTPSVASGDAGIGTELDGGTFGPNHGATNGEPGKVVKTP